jgi:hypothetical protein
MPLDQALAAIDEAALTTFTQRLVRLDSINPPGQEQSGGG